MKKLLLFVIACTLGLFSTVNAQNVITIGEGTETAYSIADNYDGHGASQQIYTAAEIGSAGTITSIAFHKANGADYNRTWSVYLKNIDEESFTSTTNYAMTSADLVYEGTFHTSNGWNVLDIDDFQYDGRNLLVTVVDNSGYELYGGDQNWYYAFVYNDSKCLTKYTYQNIDITQQTSFSAFSGRFNIQLTITAGEGGGEEPTPDPGQPEEPVAVEYRLEKIEGGVSYVYESETSNKVVEIKNSEYYSTFLQYNANGVLTGSQYGWVYDGTISTDSYSDIYTNTEYTYTDGVVTSYKETEFQNWYSYEEPYSVTEYTLAYNAQGKLETITDVDGNGGRVVTFTYDEEGRLVKKERTYYFVWDNPRVDYVDYSLEYVYDANGNCISETDYAIVEGEKTAKSVKQYFYNEAIAAEKAYVFAYPYEVKPAQANVLVKTVAYNANQDEYTTQTYVYNPEIAEDAILAPVGLTAEAISDTEIELNWSVVAETESFVIYNGETEVATTTEISYTVTGLTPATEYCFTVVGVNGEVESPASEPACATTEETLTSLDAPVATVTKVTETTITIAWEAVEKAISYNVYVGEAEAVNVTETTYTATGLTPATQYCFVVTAVNGDIESAKPEAVCATTEEGVVLPENMVAIGGGDELGSYPFSLDNIGVNETYGYTAYGVSQQLYTAEEIAKEAGFIKSYALKFAGPKTDPSFETAAEQEDVVVEFEIYVQNTELETLQENVTEQASTQVVEAEDLYYAGKTTLVNGDWTTFEFDYPFEYKGGNIIVTIYCLSVENGKTNWYPFYVYNTESTAITSLQICPTERPTTGKAISPINAYYTRNQVLLTFTEEGEVVPEKPKEYRLESIESYSVESYVYDETYTNRVVSFVGTDGLNNVLTYNEAGQLETVKSISESEEEISSIEYTYNEDGTLASYSETSKHPATGAMITTTTNYTYENGRLAKVENVDWEIEMTYVYNEDGTVKEVLESGKLTTLTYKDGKLVNKVLGYEDEESGEFIEEAKEVYTYDVNGNCVKQESYEYGSLYQVHEYFYDATIAAEDVYSFALPHMAITAVEPVSNNVLVKALSYYSNFDEEVGEVVTHTYNVIVYNYSPAIELAPITPMNLAAEVTDDVVKLTWEAFVDAELFIVYQDGEAVAEDVKEGVYTIEGLEEGEYTFAVQAVNAVGRSSVTEEIEVTVGEEPIAPAVPAAPVVEVVEVTETTIVFAWAPVEGATKYNVYAYGELAGSTPDTIAGFKDLDPNTEYCFTVTAVNEVGESAPSEKVCATTKPEGIAENAAAFNIYPNPVADRLFIETEANVEEVTIYTLTGVMVYSEVDFNNNSIDVSNLNSGVYFVKVVTENGEAVQRFIKK